VAIAGNYFEEQLIKDLHNEVIAGELLIEPESIEYFSRLAELYPVLGSKIQWSEVPGAIELKEESANLQLSAFSAFFKKMVEIHRLKGRVIYIGDSAINFSLLSSVDVFVKHLDAIFSIPQHHYFIAEDYSWCLVFTMEGDMSFGLPPYLFEALNVTSRNSK